jgi:tetratricopeptide (TPR) repeat protein
MSPKQTIYEQAYSAVQNREYGFARRLLAQLLNQEPNHLHGWLLASYAMKTRAEAIKCLERVLQIDPANAHAKKRLVKLQQKSTHPSPTLLLHLSAERPTVPPAKESM